MTYQTPTPEQIIEAFDACREYIWGHGRGRDNPHKTDKDTASRWIAGGVIVPIAAVVFHERMSAMYERWLRSDPNDRTHLPSALKVFDDNILAAITRFTKGPLEPWEGELSRWGNRVRGWQKNPSLWNEDMWGPPPQQPGCRAPLEIIKNELTRP